MNVHTKVGNIDLGNIVASSKDSRDFIHMVVETYEELASHVVFTSCLFCPITIDIIYLELKKIAAEETKEWAKKEKEEKERKDREFKEKLNRIL